MLTGTLLKLFLFRFVLDNIKTSTVFVLHIITDSDITIISQQLFELFVGPKFVGIIIPCVLAQSSPAAVFLNTD